MNDDPPTYLELSHHYEACFAQHGDCAKGVDWPKPPDVPTRYRVMLEVIRSHTDLQLPSLLDLGSGLGHLYDYIVEHDLPLHYAGLDISPLFVARCRTKYPNLTFYCADILQDSEAIPNFDYVVMNGLFTARRTLSFEQMDAYVKRMLEAVFSKCQIGMAFNVMSTQVDWKRDDLFHLPMDHLSNFLSENISRHFVFRHDYGLYEYTVYVYRQPPAFRDGTCLL